MLQGTQAEQPMLPQGRNNEAIEDHRVFYVSPETLTGSFAKNLTMQSFYTDDAVIDTLGETILVFKRYASDWVEDHESATMLIFDESCSGRSRSIESWGAEVEAAELWQFLENMKQIPEVQEWNKPLIGFVDLCALQQNIFNEIVVENEKEV